MTSPPRLPELRQALQFDAGLVDAHYTLGIVLWQLGDFAASEQEMRAAVEQRPDYAQAWFMLGTVLKQKGDLDMAASALREAIRLDLSTPGPYNTLAQVLQLKGDSVKAQEAFRRGAEVKRAANKSRQPRSALEQALRTSHAAISPWRREISKKR